MLPCVAYVRFEPLIASNTFEAFSHAADHSYFHLRFAMTAVAAVIFAINTLGRASLSPRVSVDDRSLTFLAIAFEQFFISQLQEARKLSQ
ncbi:MAG: hypothetical protein EBY29_16430 [Planctomycetes bacterium]|nr:hypothetical protein [Planctomycetota bacterium]